MKETVLDVLGALSILFAFLFMMVSSAHRQVDGDVALSRPLVPHELEKSIKRVTSTLFWPLLPKLTLGLVLSYVMLPLFLSIVDGTRFTVWDFDEVLTVYCLLTAVTIGVTTWVSVLFIRICIKRRCWLADLEYQRSQKDKLLAKNVG